MNTQRRLLIKSIPVLAALLVWVSLTFIRHQIILHLSLDYAHAWLGGIQMGWLSDFAASMIVVCAYFIERALFNTSGKTSAWVAAALIWVSSLVNLAYFRFFQSSLNWDTVVAQYKDILVVHDFAHSLLFTPAVVTSAFVFVGALLILGKAKRPQSRPRLSHAPSAIVAVIAMLLLHQSPRWLHWNDRFEGSILADQVLSLWWTQAWENQISTDNPIAMSSAHPEAGTPAHILSEYRDFVRFPRKGLVQKKTPSANANWPLVQNFDPSQAESRALRAKLGLPAQGDLNYIVLFLESTRDYELEHPVLGEQIFPKLKSILKTHGIFFERAYSSANITVRGQFSTLCSMPVNLADAPVYFSYPDLKVTCVQEYLKSHGYETVWLNSYSKEFHNKEGFESQHGMHLFFDGKYFQEKGIHEQVGGWGLADKPVLEETLRTLEEISTRGKPFFAHFLTISTHGPFDKMVPEGAIPDSLVQATRENTEYQSYLTRLHYSDEAVSNFFDKFFKSRLADNTVVFVVADHGVSVKPTFPIGSGGMHEVAFRIPLAIITKNMAQPQVISTPVNQIDIVPTIGLLTGKPGSVSWIGRDLFSEHGSPWAAGEGTAVAYRTLHRACYPELGQTKCFDLSHNEDPLFTQDLISVPARSDQTSFFRGVMAAAKQSVLLDAIQP